MTESKKKLVVGSIEKQEIKNPYSPYGNIYGKTSYQVFCPKCNYGPMFTAETGLICERCGRKLIVARMPGGDYKVAVIE